MTVQSGLRIEGALIGNLQLVHSIVIDVDDRILGFLAFAHLGFFCDRCCQRAEWKSHEDTIEPNLI